MRDRTIFGDDSLLMGCASASAGWQKVIWWWFQRRYFEQRMYWGRDLKGVLVSLFAFFFFFPPSSLSGKRSFVTL